MIQSIRDHPLVFLSLLMIIVLLQVLAALRLRHERKRKQRALVDRRQSARTEPDRRWQPRPHHK